MEEFPERDELRRMQREQERERRRIRDRQRRQSMTQEQRERHLARRRRNYQLRRQRAANNAGGGFMALSQPQFLESSAGEPSTSDELQGGATSSTPLDYSVLHLGLNQGHQTLTLGNKVVEGLSVHCGTLAFRPANSSGRLRLTRIRSLARNLTRLTSDSVGTHKVAAELITKEDVTSGEYGSTQKSLRLNSVKRLARSINCPPKDTAAQKNHNLSQEGNQLLAKESFITSSQI